MAEINVKKKQKKGGSWILAVILLVIVALVLILDATENITTPNLIDNTGTEEPVQNETNN